MFHALLFPKHSSQSKTPLTSSMLTPNIAAAVLLTPAMYHQRSDFPRPNSKQNSQRCACRRDCNIDIEGSSSPTAPIFNVNSKGTAAWLNDRIGFRHPYGEGKRGARGIILSKLKYCTVLDFRRKSRTEIQQQQALEHRTSLMALPQNKEYASSTDLFVIWQIGMEVKFSDLKLLLRPRA